MLECVYYFVRTCSLLTNVILFICLVVLEYEDKHGLLLFTHEPIVICKNWQLWYLIILNWTYPYPFTIRTLNTFGLISIQNVIRLENVSKNERKHRNTDFLFHFFFLLLFATNFKVVCYCYASATLQTQQKNYPY